MWELTLGYSMRGPVFFFWAGWVGGGIFSLFFFGGVVMPLGQAKNSDINTFGNKSSMQPMMAQHGLMRGLIFFLFAKDGGGISCLFPLVPISYLSSQAVPQSFPITPHFYPICFGKCCPPFTRVGGSKGRNSILQNRTLYFLLRFLFYYFLYLRSDGQIKLAHCKKKIEIERYLI